jgi:hypothetical protein
LAILHRHASHPGVIVGSLIYKERINPWIAFFNDGSDHGEPAVLVPSAALVKIGKNQKGRDEQERLDRPVAAFV